MKQLIITLILSLSTVMLTAQPQPQHERPRFDPQKFQQMVERELTQVADLTPVEAKAFFPLYNEMRKKQRELGRQIRILKSTPTPDDKAYANIIARIMSLKVEMAELEQSYYKRFIEIVPPEKLFKMMCAEDEFHRRMVRGSHRKRK